MTTEGISNDNDASADGSHRAGQDAHGRAAILLVESLIHGLIARSVLDVADAIGIVGIAAEVGEAIEDESPEGRRAVPTSSTLLGAIRASLQHDLPEESG